MKKSLRIFLAAMMSLLMVFALTACSGSSSSDNSANTDPGDTVTDPGDTVNAPAEYTGSQDQATIDESNGEEILTEASEAGNASDSVMSGLSALSVGDNNVSFSQNRALLLSTVLKNSVDRIDLQSGIVSARAASSYEKETIYEDSGTTSGSCGGSASYTVRWDDVSGDFEMNMTFSDFCEDGVILNGTASITGVIDMDTGELMSFTFALNSLQMQTTAGTSIITGTIAFTFQSSSYTVVSNITLTDGATGNTYWCKDYVMSITSGSGYGEVSVSGTFYSPSRGYIVLSTESPLHINDADSWPTSGALVVTGKNNSKARLTCLSSTTYKVEVDADGDGAYEWSSGTKSWTGGDNNGGSGDLTAGTWISASSNDSSFLAFNVSADGTSISTDNSALIVSDTTYSVILFLDSETLGCGSETYAGGTSTEIPIEENSFTYSPNSSVEMSGTFSSSTSASGNITIAISTDSCSKTISLNWEAVPTSAGATSLSIDKIVSDDGINLSGDINDFDSDGR